MDKIEQCKGERVNKDIWIEAYWDIKDIANKVNELIEGHNEIMPYIELLKLQTTFYDGMLEKLDNHIKQK